jgi:hypothetical protein
MRKDYHKVKHSFCTEIRKFCSPEMMLQMSFDFMIFFTFFQMDFEL